MIRVRRGEPLLLISVIMFCAILATVLLCCSGYEPNQFHDLLFGGAASYNLNKDDETKIFWGVCLLGVAMVWAGLLVLQRKCREKETEVINGVYVANIGIEKKTIVYSLLFLLTAFFTNGLFYGDWSGYLAVLAVEIIVLYCFGREALLERLSCCLLVGLDVLAFEHVMLLCGLSISASAKPAPMVASSITLLVVLCCPKKFLRRIVLLLQPLLIFLFAPFFMNRYVFENEIVYLQMPVGYLALFGLIALVLFFLMVRKAVRMWSMTDREYEIISSNGGFVSVASGVCVVLFYSGYQPFWKYTNQLYAVDSKDVTENLMGFSQILLGNGLYSDYFPVQGLLSVPQGALLELFGGTVEAMSMAQMAFHCLVFLTLLCLLRERISGFFLLLGAYVLYLPSYDRSYAVLLGLFLLFDKKLLKNRNLWLKSWILSCFLAGLYYPMQGVGLLIATLPVGISQLVSWIKSGECRGEAKNWSFFAAWGICLLPILLSVPLLWRIVKHILTYAVDSNHSLQTAPLFGKDLSNRIFLPMILSPAWKQLSYYMLRYTTLFALVLITIYYLFRTVGGRVNIDKNLIWESAALVLLGVVEIWNGIVRGSGSHKLEGMGICMIPFFLAFFIFSIKYLHFDRRGVGFLIAITFLISIFGFVRMDVNDNKAWRTAFTVPKETIELSEEMEFPRLGSAGYIPEEFYQSLQNDSEKLSMIRTVAPDISFYGIRGHSYTELFAMNLPAYGQLTNKEIRTWEAWQQLKTVLLKKRPAIGKYISITSYYIYHWLLTTDEYRYAPELELFLPSEVYSALGLDEADHRYEAEFGKAALNTYQMANAFGRSMPSLMEKLNRGPCNLTWTKKTKGKSVEDGTKTNSDSRFDVKADQPVSGADYDFLYVKFSGDTDVKYEGTELEVFSGCAKRVDVETTVSWLNDSTGKTDSIKYALGNGELLIPLGLKQSWLLQNVRSFSISVAGRDVDIEEMYLVGLKRR